VVVSGIDSSSFEAEISGSGSIRTTGRTEKLQARVSGSGNLSMFDLVAKDADMRISGAGKAEINATDSLKARVSGVGDVRYKGSPKNVEKSVSGVGSIKPE
jgi:hypothetical protein